MVQNRSDGSMVKANDALSLSFAPNKRSSLLDAKVQHSRVPKYAMAVAVKMHNTVQKGYRPLGSDNTSTFCGHVSASENICAFLQRIPGSSH